MSSRRWFNNRLPQTLAIAQFLLYFNAFMTKRGWRDDYAEKLAASKTKRGWSDRADLQTSFDLQDAEEGRK
jgi:hypothetical protein